MPAAGMLRPSRWSLRARLLVALVSLLALVCLAVGAATTVALRHFLLGRLDAQLVAAGGRSASAGGRPPEGPGPGPAPDSGDRTDVGARFLLAPGQPPGTLGARIADGRVTAAGVLSEGGSLRLLPAADAAALAALPPDGQPRTRTIPGQGGFRMLAAQMPDGDVLVTGLPLHEVHDTLYWLAAAETVVAGVALLAATLAGAVIVRRALRPLRRVAAIATRVSALPLERGEVDLAERVPQADTDPRTEVGRVGSALNRLLDTVAAALAARQASETRVRQLVADAGHELRTPLAAIRGYAEMTRRSREQAPPDLAHVFDRFARGDSSRSRGAGSTGLGLAIVHAIVTAHRGSVQVTSRPGRTAFVVRLPAAPAVPPDAGPGLRAIRA